MVQKLPLALTRLGNLDLCDDQEVHGRVVFIQVNASLLPSLLVQGLQLFNHVLLTQGFQSVHFLPEEEKAPWVFPFQEIAKGLESTMARKEPSEQCNCKRTFFHKGTSRGKQFSLLPLAPFFPEPVANCEFHDKPSIRTQVFHMLRGGMFFVDFSPEIAVRNITDEGICVSKRHSTSGHIVQETISHDVVYLQDMNECR